MSQIFELQPGESTVLSFRRHWIRLVTQAGATILAGALPFMLYGYLLYAGLVPPGLRSAHVFAFAGAWWLLIVWMALSIVCTDYFLDMWVVTNRRVISVEQIGLFDRNISTWGIERIEEVVVRVDGFLATMLGYGSLEIKTAGNTGQHAKAHFVPNPGQIREVIMSQASRISSLERTTKNQEELLHTISHEVKSYLSKDAAALASIAEGDFGEVPESVKNLAQTALGETRKGVSAVMDMLKDSDGGSGTMGLSMKTIDLRDMVQAVYDEFKPAADKKKLSFTLSMPAEDCILRVDETKLRDLVIRNLIDNAIRYTPHGFVAVEVLRKPEAIICTISDSGVGITTEDQSRLFTEGGHGKDSKSINPESTGFGLSAAKRTVEAHNGKIVARSEGKDRGTTFIVGLPTESV